MADTAITGLTAATTFLGTDLFEMVIDPAGTPLNRKIAANVVGSGFALLTGADANTTMVVNSSYIVDMTAWATADRDYTLPTTATVGDRVRVSVLVGNASFELLIKTGAGQTCAHAGAVIAAATEVTRVFITGESMEFVYAAANKWLVRHDARIPMQGLLRLSTAATTSTVNAFVYATAHGGVWTADVNIGSVCDTATDKIIFRRACKADLALGGRSNATVTDAKYCNWSIEKNAVTNMAVPSFVAAVTGLNASGTVILKGPAFAVNDYIRFKFRTEEADKGLASSAADAYSSYIAATEVL